MVAVARVGVMLLGLIGPTGAADAAKPIQPPAYGEFLVIPLRVHVLKASDLPEVDCALTDADIRRVVGKVNGIWHQAGIHWGLEPILREPAANQEEFKKARDRSRRAFGVPLGLFETLVPRGSKDDAGLHVYYIHRFAVNGVYFGESTVFVQEKADLRPVEGGIDEPLPRVTAHELGHALGLAHRQDRTNLLASGTTGTSLNAAEVETARSIARTIKGARGVAEVRRAAEVAEKAGDRATARRLWSHLAEIPGDGAAEAGRRRDALDAPG